LVQAQNLEYFSMEELTYLNDVNMNKQNNRVRQIILIIFKIICITFISLILCALCVIIINGGIHSDYSEKINDRYLFVHESNELRYIFCPNKSIIPITVSVYEHNTDFIIALQKPQLIDLSCSYEDTAWRNKYLGDSLCFWIIEMKTDSIYGPLNLNDYLRFRNELHIPDDLKLRIDL
jgi:hypothetical protein